MAEAQSKYVGMGLYISSWQRHDGPEGNLRRDDMDLMDGPGTAYATASEPEKFVGTFATFPEIESG